jgi:hypothetical protein
MVRIARCVPRDGGVPAAGATPFDIAAPSVA